MTSALRPVRLLAVTLITVLPMVIFAIPVSANPGLTVSNALILTDVTPGQTLTHTMTVAIAGGDPAIDMSVQVTGVGQSLQGDYELLDAARDTGQFSARTFVSVDNSSLHLEPGSSQSVTATVQVPQDVGSGGRYAIINIATKPAPGTGVGIITAANVPVFLTIKGSQVIETGKITGLSTATITAGQPISILTNFQNTGNHHFKVQGQVIVKNDRGQALATITMPVTASSILPGMTRQLLAIFTPSGPLLAGTYTIDARVALPDNTPLGETTNTFRLADQYVPPSVTPSSTSTTPASPSAPTPAPSSLGTASLTPSKASILQNADGSISIYFPPGAAITNVEVLLENYSIAQISALPPGVTAASTCFRVNGLTGLLAKEATVTVKYAAADLSKAGGDASKLKLARWDAGSQWTVLESNVNTGAMTLTASSNQMSIWAVVVGSSPSGASWVMMAVIAAVALIIVVVLILFLIRRKR
jgi:hypothetical protein